MENDSDKISEQLKKIFSHNGVSAKFTENNTGDPNMNIKQKYIINGKEYGSLEEIPEDAKLLLKKRLSQLQGLNDTFSQNSFSLNLPNYRKNTQIVKIIKNPLLILILIGTIIVSFGSSFPQLLYVSLPFICPNGKFGIQSFHDTYHGTTYELQCINGAIIEDKTFQYIFVSLIIYSLMYLLIFFCLFWRNKQKEMEYKL